MKIYPKQSKASRESGNFYFGNYGEIPIGISFAEVINTEDETQDKLHYHIKSNEFYITLEWEWILEIEGKEMVLQQNEMIMVEPNEKHRIIKATKTPFRFIAISTEKDKDDKVISE